MTTFEVQRQTEEQRTVPTPRPARSLTLEEAKEIVAQNRVMAALLEPYDGPTAQIKTTPKK